MNPLKQFKLICTLARGTCKALVVEMRIREMQNLFKERLEEEGLREKSIQTVERMVENYRPQYQKG